MMQSRYTVVTCVSDLELAEAKFLGYLNDIVHNGLQEKMADHLISHFNGAITIRRDHMEGYTEYKLRLHVLTTDQLSHLLLEAEQRGRQQEFDERLAFVVATVKGD